MSAVGSTPPLVQDDWAYGLFNDEAVRALDDRRSVLDMPTPQPTTIGNPIRRETRGA
jgi:hypothetical protein